MSFLRNLLAPKDVVKPFFHDSIDDKGIERKLGFHPIGLTLPSADSSKYEGN